MKVVKSGAFGDIKKLSVKVEDKDISTAAEYIQIYQEIFSPCWSAVVTIDDNANMLMNIPIRPGTEIEIEVETETESVLDGNKTYKMVIYKIGDKIFKGQMHQRYNLYCATKNFLKNQGIRISKSYSNKKPEEACKSIISEYLGGEVESDESDNNYHIIIPNWSPFTAAWWCAKLAIKNNSSDFIFFLKDDDKYWFKSVEELYKNEDTGITFKQKPANFRGDSGDYEDDYSIMITKYNFEHYEGLGNLGSGYYRNKLLTYDFINKKFEEKLFTFGDDNQEDKEKKPWDTELFDGAENANVSFMPVHPGLHSNSTIDDTVKTWHTSRMSRLMVLEQDNYTLQIPGGAKCWEWLGRTCEIDLPSHQDQEDEVYDKYFRGKYFVKAISHILTPDYYTTNLQCCKIRMNEKMEKKN